MGRGVSAEHARKKRRYRHFSLKPIDAMSVILKRDRSRRSNREHVRRSARRDP
jgi:hypothetical protein